MCSAQYLGEILIGRPVATRGVHHGLVHALGVHVDLDLAAAGGDAVEDGLPELVAAFFDAALAVDAEGDAADRRAGFQQRADGIAAVGAVRFRGEPFDGVVGVRAVDPLVAVHPEAELEIDAAGHGLLADELQHFQVAVALGVGELRDAHVVAGDVEQERIGEEKIGVGDAAQEVVADAEAQVEAVEALGGQHREVARPHFAVVVPGLVFDVAGEEAGDAADRVGGALRKCCLDGEGGGRVGGVADAVGKFEEGVDQAARVVAGGEQDVATADFGRSEREGLGDGRRASLLVAGGDDAEVGGSGLCDAVHDAGLDAADGERCGKFAGGPTRGGAAATGSAGSSTMATGRSGGGRPTRWRPGRWS